MYLPHRYAHKVQNVPAISQVCVCVKKKSISNNLQETFDREDDEEDVLQTFLKKKHDKVLFYSLSYPSRSIYMFISQMFGPIRHKNAKAE